MKAGAVKGWKSKVESYEEPKVRKYKEEKDGQSGQRRENLV